MIIILIKSLKIINNNISKGFAYSSSIVLLVYSGLQIYGIQNNVYYEPKTSFIQKERYVEFITVETTKELEKEIKNSQKPVMVDLYADWCVACKELEKYTFSAREVRVILNELKLVKFDITNTNENHSAYLQSMRIFGPPALFFYDKDGNEIENARVVGFIESDDFLKILNIVKK